MSGLASHGRGVTSGVLRRTVSNPVTLHPSLINGIKQRSDASDAHRNVWTRSDFEVMNHQSAASKLASEVISDFGYLERALGEIEDCHSSTKRALDGVGLALESLPAPPCLPRSPRPQENTVSALDASCSGSLNISAFTTKSQGRSGNGALPDSPIYSSFQRELSLLRGGEQTEDRINLERSPSRPATPSRASPQPQHSQQSNQALQSQLDEARASNRMVQRALAAVQVYSYLARFQYTFSFRVCH